MYRVCKESGNGEVEDINHFVMRCAYVVKERERLESLMSSRVEGWDELGENEKVLRVMDRACSDETVTRAVASKHFDSLSPVDGNGSEWSIHACVAKLLYFYLVFNIS